MRSNKKSSVRSIIDNENESPRIFNVESPTLNKRLKIRNIKTRLDKRVKTPMDKYYKMPDTSNIKWKKSRKYLTNVLENEQVQKHMLKAKNQSFTIINSTSIHMFIILEDESNRCLNQRNANTK